MLMNLIWQVNGRYLEPVIARFRSLSSAVERSSNSNPLDAQRMRFLARSSIETLLFSLSSNPVNFQPPMQAIRCVVLWSKSVGLYIYIFYPYSCLFHSAVGKKYNTCRWSRLKNIYFLNLIRKVLETTAGGKENKGSKS